MPLTLDRLSPNVRALIEGLQSATSNDEGDEAVLLNSWPKRLFLEPDEIRQLPLTPVQKGLIAFAQLESSYPAEVAARRAGGQSLAEIFHALAAKAPEWLFPPSREHGWFPDHLFAGIEPDAARLSLWRDGKTDEDCAEILLNQRSFAKVTHSGVLVLDGVDVPPEKRVWNFAFADIPPHLRTYVRSAIEKGFPPYAYGSCDSPKQARVRAWTLGELDRTCPIRNAQLRLERARAVLESTQRVVHAEMAELSSLARLVQRER